MEFKLDMEEMERQRYNAIKKKGEYIEVDILIGTEPETLGGNTGVMPVVTNMIHGCTGKEIGCMYLTLQALMKQFEKDYPMECLGAKMLMNTHSFGTTKHKLKNDESEEE